MSWFMATLHPPMHKRIPKDPNLLGSSLVSSIYRVLRLGSSEVVSQISTLPILFFPQKDVAFLVPFKAAGAFPFLVVCTSEDNSTESSIFGSMLSDATYSLPSSSTRLVSCHSYNEPIGIPCS